MSKLLRTLGLTAGLALACAGCRGNYQVKGIDPTPSAYKITNKDAPYSHGALTLTLPGEAPVDYYVGRTTGEERKELFGENGLFPQGEFENHYFIPRAGKEDSEGATRKRINPRDQTISVEGGRYFLRRTPYKEVTLGNFTPSRNEEQRDIFRIDNIQEKYNLAVREINGVSYFIVGVPEKLRDSKKISYFLMPVEDTEIVLSSKKVPKKDSPRVVEQVDQVILKGRVYQPELVEISALLEAEKIARENQLKRAEEQRANVEVKRLNAQKEERDRQRKAQEEYNRRLQEQQAKARQQKAQQNRVPISNQVK